MKNMERINLEVADDLVEAGRLYEEGHYDLTLVLSIRAIEKALRDLWIKEGKTGTPPFRTMVNSLIKDNLLTNKVLLQEIEVLYKLRNKIVHGIKSKEINEKTAKTSIELAYDFVGTLPYQEKDFELWKTAQYLESSITEALLSSFGKDFVAIKEPLLGKRGAVFRPDFLLKRSDGTYVVVEVKNKSDSRTINSGIAQILSYQELAKEELGENIDLWLIVPEPFEDDARILKVSKDLGVKVFSFDVKRKKLKPQIEKSQ